MRQIRYSPTCLPLSSALHHTKLHPLATFAALILLQQLKAHFPTAHRTGIVSTEGDQILSNMGLHWVEAGLQVCRQGYNMLNLLIHRKVCICCRFIFSTFTHLFYRI